MQPIWCESTNKPISVLYFNASAVQQSVFGVTAVNTLPPLLTAVTKPAICDLRKRNESVNSHWTSKQMFCRSVTPVDLRHAKPTFIESTTSPDYGQENPERLTFKFFPSANPPLWNTPPGARLFSFSHKQNPSPLPHAEHAAASVGSAERSVNPGVSWPSRLSPWPLGFSLLLSVFSVHSFHFAPPPSPPRSPSAVSVSHFSSPPPLRSKVPVCGCWCWPSLRQRTAAVSVMRQMVSLSNDRRRLFYLFVRRIARLPGSSRSHSLKWYLIETFCTLPHH